MRHQFGQGPADWTFNVGAGNTAILAGGVAVTLWDSQTSGTQQTDLLDSTGSPMTSVTSSTGTTGLPVGTIPVFYGPPSVTQLWADAGGGYRSKITAHDDFAASDEVDVPGRNPLTGAWHPEAYGAVGDYTTDDTLALQACIDACSAAGGGTVRIGQHAVSGAGIHPKTGVTIEGVPGYSKLKQLSSNFVISSSVACSSIGFRDFTIEGPVNEVPTVPKRTRTTSGPGTTFGIWLTGDLDTTAPGAPAITDVTIKNITVRNTTSLPIRISGVRGTVLTEDCLFDNCQDAGWIFCEEVRCVGNRSVWSADNGFSLSRGNLKVTCVGNTVFGAAYHGIWLSGYIGFTGPQDFVCTGNVIKNVGQSGILLQDAPKFGNVSGNTIDKGWIRGDSTAPTDEYVYGIFIRGNSSTPSAPGTSLAYGLRVANNTIYAAPRAGIAYDGAQSVVIESNLIQDCGTATLSGGGTITSSFTSQNVGILSSNPSTLDACVIRNNDIIDRRATPLCNWGIYPPVVAGVQMTGNTMTGCRNSSNLPALLDARNDGRLDDGQSAVPRWAANNTSSITMSSGTLRLAYFTARRNATVTALRFNSGSTPAGATPTLARYGIYSVASNGDLTLIGSTASDTALFSSTLTAYSRNLTSSVQVVAGQQYAVGLIFVTSAAAPTAVGVLASTGGENALSPTLCMVLTGQTDLPSSITAGSLAQTQSLVYGVAVGA